MRPIATMIEVKPCVGCGYCCEKARCVYSTRELGYIADKCPYLTHDGKRHWCELVKLGKYHDQLGVGAGCCSSLNSKRKEMEL